MSKKTNRNKKIKKKCPSCNKKNIFSKENWKGEDNTYCKYCGSKLNKIKRYKFSMTSSNQPISKTKESFYEATRPALNLYKKESKKRTWILSSIVIIFILACVFIFNNQDINTLDKINNGLNESNYSDLIPPTTIQDICSKIQKVPSWCQGEEIIGSGYKPNWNVTYLLDNKICFLYSATCSYCHKQILEFGDEWETYNSSGYTAQCW